MKELKELLDKKGLLIIMILAFIILLLPQLRFFSIPYHLDSESYYHLRIAVNLKENFIVTNDTLSYNGRDYYFNLTDFILSKLYIIDIFARILPFIFGLATIYLFYKILELIKIKHRLKLLVAAITISSPVFIFVFSTFNYLFMVVFLNVLILYLLFKKKYKLYTPLIMLIPLFNIKVVPITLILLLAFFLTKKEFKPLILSAGSLFLAAAIYYFVVIFPKFIFPDTFIMNITISTLIADFGSFFGLSVFALLLSVMGFFILWTQKKNHFFILTILICLLIPSLYFPFITIFLNFLLSYLAATAFIEIIERKWQHKIIKNATIILIFCGLLFSTTSFVNRIIENEPTNEQVGSLVWLSKHSQEQDVVFSHYKNGYIIEYFAERPVVMDEMFLYAPNFNDRLNDSNTIFQSRSLEQTTTLLDKYNVKYIWIDEKMKSGLVWNKKEQGLLFLFNDKEVFKNIYFDSGIEIWSYTG